MKFARYIIAMRDMVPWVAFGWVGDLEEVCGVISEAIEGLGVDREQSAIWRTPELAKVIITIPIFIIHRKRTADGLAKQE